MDVAAKAAKAGDRVLSILAIVLMVIMLAFGGYSLWDTYVTMTGAFLNRDLLKYKPTANNPEETRLSLEELLKINPDTRGWITIDGTHIDYPMVQGRDDMEYVNKDVTCEFSLSGAIFLSAYNKADYSDPYMLTYGHHMDNGGMYGDVMNYIQKEYFDQHLTGNLFMPDGRARKMEVFACIECDAYDRMIYQVEGRGGNIMELVDYLKEKSTNYRDIGIKESDQIMALSTCVSLETNGRVVVLARVNP
jgi:sortase, srtB family